VFPAKSHGSRTCPVKGEYVSRSIVIELSIGSLTVYFPLLNSPKHLKYAICPLSSFLPPASSSRTTALLHPTHSYAISFPVPEDTSAPSMPQSKNPSELRANTCCLRRHYNNPLYSDRCEICSRPLKRIAADTQAITTQLSSFSDRRESQT